MFLLVNVDDDDPELEHAVVNTVALTTKRTATTAAGRTNNRLNIISPWGGVGTSGDPEYSGSLLLTMPDRPFP